MLVEIKKLEILNEGYKRRISINKIFVNPTHIISIRDYEGVRDFLLSENAHGYLDKKYSLVKINNVNGTEEIIAVGTSDQIQSSIHSKPGRQLLND